TAGDGWAKAFEALDRALHRYERFLRGVPGSPPPGPAVRRVAGGRPPGPAVRGGEGGRPPGPAEGGVAGGGPAGQTLRRAWGGGRAWAPASDVRRAAMRRCAEWIIARQERDGCWGGIQPPWVYSLIALSLLGYGLEHPVIQRGLVGLDRFTIWEETADGPVRR